MKGQWINPLLLPFVSNYMALNYLKSSYNGFVVISSVARVL
jgi:hypothetical protein